MHNYSVAVSDPSTDAHLESVSQFDSTTLPDTTAQFVSTAQSNSPARPNSSAQYDTLTLSNTNAQFDSSAQFNPIVLTNTISTTTQYDSSAQYDSAALSNTINQFDSFPQYDLVLQFDTNARFDHSEYDNVSHNQLFKNLANNDQTRSFNSSYDITTLRNVEMSDIGPSTFNLSAIDMFCDSNLISVPLSYKDMQDSPQIEALYQNSVPKFNKYSDNIHGIETDFNTQDSQIEMNIELNWTDITEQPSDGDILEEYV